MHSHNSDVIVIGADLVGGALAWGLARRGLDVAMLDEEDAAYRASRGNFGLVWVQGKGAGFPAYARWTRHSSDRWAELADELARDAGLDVAYRRPGGVVPALSEDELREQTTAWYNDINATQRGVDWQMKVDDARIKLKSIYPQIKL